MQLKQYLVDARHLAGLVDSAGRQADGMSQSAPAGALSNCHTAFLGSCSCCVRRGLHNELL